ncbi:MAG: hypothetical protein OK474_00870 [Thaumarchaeota archaeon]|nr:hypothetical protein [Nitrososphaerota archaeon]
MSRRPTLIGLVLCLLLSLSPFTAHAYSNGQTASIALGQPNLTGDYSATSQTGLTSNGYADPQYSGVAVDTSGDIWVADSGNNRVLEFASPWSNGEKASLVLGQPDFKSSSAATTASGMNDPRGVFVDKGGNVWVADSGNNRVLEFLWARILPLPGPLVKSIVAIGFTNGQAASLLVGQQDFKSSSAATTQTGLNFPTGVAIGPAGNLWVADNKNNRVLQFTHPFSNGEKASLALGQDGYKSSAESTDQYGLWHPYGIAVDSHGNVWVADSGNSRVVEFDSNHVQNQVENIVLGQPSFSYDSPVTSKTGMSSPLGVTVDAHGNVWVADSGNNRVLEFLKGKGFTDAQAGYLVLGQSGFTSSTLAYTAFGPTDTSSTGLGHPTGVAVDSRGNIWVADSDNDRVLQFRSATTTKVSCVPDTVHTGNSSCTFTVSNTGKVTVSPSGTVMVTSTGPVKASGSCTISWSGSSASCTLSINTDIVGTYSVAATYGGDGRHLGSTGTATVTVSIG